MRAYLSFSLNFHSCVCACCHIIATSPQTICHHHQEASHVHHMTSYLQITTDHLPSSRGGFIHHMTSYLRSIVPQTFIAAIEFIRPSWLKRGTVFEKMNLSHTGKRTALLTSCGGTTRNTPSDQEIDRIIIAHDMASAL